MEAFPFQSNFTGFDETGNPVFDRAVGAEFIRAREKLFFTNGIFAAPSDNFQVMNGTGLQIIVRPGTCFIEGVTGIEIEETVLEIATAAELSARTDIVVLRCDFVNRWIELAVKTGTKELTRTGNIYELKIAEITVPKMALEISQSNILDTRLSAECGVVATIPNHVDTSTIFNQYLEKWKEISAVMSQNASQFSTGFNMYGVANGVDNYTVTIDGAMVVDGANFKIKFMNASSGAQPTLNINALGAKPIKRMNGTIPKIVAGSYLNLIYSESAGAFYPAGEGLGGTATPAQVFAGYTFTNDDGIQEGAAILGDAAANQVLKGAKFSSNKAGTNVAGTIPSKGAATITPGTTNKTIEAGQYLSGTQTIVGSANLKPENIKQGVNIMGIIGSCIPMTSLYITEYYTATFKGNTAINGGSSSNGYRFGFFNGTTIGTMSCPLGIKAIYAKIDNQTNELSNEKYITSAGTYTLTASDYYSSMNLSITISGSTITIKAASSCYASGDKNEAGTTNFLWTSANGYSSSSKNCFMKIIVKVFV